MTKKAVQHVKDLVKDFDRAMLITQKRDDEIHVRPMQIAEANEKGVLRFATSLRSAKVDEISDNDRVNLVFQNSSKFLVMSGKAKIETNVKLINRLWSESWRVWFPEGKGDPSICFITITPKDAEFWDNSGTKGIAYAFKAAKAYIQGTMPEEDSDAHGKVSL
jgi:general stress protein 26